MGLSTSRGGGTADDERFGLWQLNDSVDLPTGTEQYSLDIVAVHGITGDYINTWTYEKEDAKTKESTTFMWLKDVLPQRLPGARIFSYGYDASVFQSRGTGNIEDFARGLLSGLAGERASEKVCLWKKFSLQC